MAKQILLENDLFKIVDNGDCYAIFQKKTDAEGTNFVHKVWQSVGYDAVTGNQAQEFELLLLLLMNHIKSTQETTVLNEAEILELVQPS